MREKTFENSLKKWMVEQGFFFVKFFANSYTPKGIPDILACCHGRFIGLEVKSDCGVPTRIQILRLKQICNAGGIGILIYPDSFDEFKRLVNGNMDFEEPMLLKGGFSLKLRDFYDIGGFDEQNYRS